MLVVVNLEPKVYIKGRQPSNKNTRVKDYSNNPKLIGIS
jgi:hypothetical protein